MGCNIMIGKTINHYKIIEKLGQGGMGVVYKAEDINLDRFVALKFLPPHLTGAEAEKNRFIHEAKAASALDHPNICSIYEINETDDGQLFIAMACYEGESLKDKIDHGPLPVDEALDIAIQIATGLRKAHEKGIIHRDIKPANIFVTEEGQVKIIDFGLAKLAGSSLLTREGTTLGTVAYMSPEQAQGTNVDNRTDIWALGVILYEMLTGERPFKGDYEQAVIYSILNDEPEPLRKHNTAIPEELEKIVNKTLSKKSAERYSNINNVLKDLIALTDHQRLPAIRSTVKNFYTRKRNYIVAGFILILFIIGLNMGVIRDWILTENSSGGKIRLAVLPFANLSGDPEQEYLNDGLTQEMITHLGRIHPSGLNVIARTSVMRYKMTATPIDQVGRELGVDYILEGSVQQEAGRVSVNAELVNVKTQMQLWSDTYEEEMSSILALQKAVARRIIRALMITLLPKERVWLNEVRTVDPGAYDAYLKGIHYRTSLTKAGLDAAEHYFTLALEKDPDYAAAWAWMARVWTGRQQMGIVPAKEATPKAKSAAIKALARDDTEVEAHRALAGILTWGDWDWKAAEQEWKRVLELDPGHADAMAAYSHFLMHLGRKQEAMEKIEKALALDPFNEKNLSFYAIDLLYMRQYEDAVAVARKTLSLQSGYPVAMTALIESLFMLGRYEELMTMERQRWGGDPELLAVLESGYAEAGYPGAKRRHADMMAASYGKSGGMTAYDLADFYAHAGDTDRVIDWLEQAYHDHDSNLPYIGIPVFDLVRSKPRFQELLKKMHLPLGGMK